MTPSHESTTHARRRHDDLLVVALAHVPSSPIRPSDRDPVEGGRASRRGRAEEGPSMDPGAALVEGADLCDWRTVVRSESAESADGLADWIALMFGLEDVVKHELDHLDHQ